MRLLIGLKIWEKTISKACKLKYLRIKFTVSNSIGYNFEVPVVPSSKIVEQYSPIGFSASMAIFCIIVDQYSCHWPLWLLMTLNIAVATENQKYKQYLILIF